MLAHRDGVPEQPIEGRLGRVHGRRSDEVVHRLRNPARASEGVRQRQRHRPPIFCRHAPPRLRIVPDAVDRPVGERARRAQLHLGLRERDTSVRTIAQQDGRRREICGSSSRPRRARRQWHGAQGPARRRASSPGTCRNSSRAALSASASGPTQACAPRARTDPWSRSRCCRCQPVPCCARCR